MAAFLVPRTTAELPPHLASIVSRLWEVECLEVVHEEI